MTHDPRSTRPIMIHTTHHDPHDPSRSTRPITIHTTHQFIWAAFNPIMCVWVLAFNGSIYLLVPLIPVLFLAYRVGRKYVGDRRLQQRHHRRRRRRRRRRRHWFNEHKMLPSNTTDLRECPPSLLPPPPPPPPPPRLPPPGTSSLPESSSGWTARPSRRSTLTSPRLVVKGVYCQASVDFLCLLVSPARV